MSPIAYSRIPYARYAQCYQPVDSLVKLKKLELHVAHGCICVRLDALISTASRMPRNDGIIHAIYHAPKLFPH